MQTVIEHSEVTNTYELYENFFKKKLITWKTWSVGL